MAKQASARPPASPAINRRHWSGVNLCSPPTITSPPTTVPSSMRKLVKLKAGLNDQKDAASTQASRAKTGMSMPQLASRLVRRAPRSGRRSRPMTRLTAMTASSGAMTRDL